MNNDAFFDIRHYKTFCMNNDAFFFLNIPMILTLILIMMPPSSIAIDDVTFCLIM